MPRKGWRKYATPEETRAAHMAQTKASNERRRADPERGEQLRAYMREYNREHPEPKREYQREYQPAYRKTEAGQAAISRYTESEKGRGTRRRYNRRYDAPGGGRDQLLMRRAHEKMVDPEAGAYTGGGEGMPATREPAPDDPREVDDSSPWYYFLEAGPFGVRRRMQRESLSERAAGRTRARIERGRRYA